MSRLWPADRQGELHGYNGGDLLEFVSNPRCCSTCNQMDGTTMTATEWRRLPYWTPHPYCECKLVLVAQGGFDIVAPRY